MSKFKKFILLNLILILSSCGTIKEGMENQKKNSSDEFLVEKKSPLVMPPDFEQLPIPKTNKIENSTDINQFEKLIIIKSNNNNSDISQVTDRTFEDLILEKIKNN